MAPGVTVTVVRRSDGRLVSAEVVQAVAADGEAAAADARRPERDALGLGAIVGA